jgi:uncharacterized protein YutE (UPF0331/DUF86 family)
MDGEKRILRSERIYEYLDNIRRQILDLERMPVADSQFFLDLKNFERTKAIKYSLACAIEDLVRVSLHLIVSMGLGKATVSGAEAITILGNNGIIPKEFAEKIKRLPGFRNRIIHDYLPNEFDAEKIYEGLQNLEDFKSFSRYISHFLESEKKA